MQSGTGRLAAEFVQDAVAWDRIESELDGRLFPTTQNTLVQLSMPKSGTHLLRNLLLGFLGAGAYDNGPWFLTDPSLFIDERLTLELRPNTFKNLHAGHDEFAFALTYYEQPPYRTILLMRHPAATLLSVARQVYNTHIQRADLRRMRDEMTFEDVLEAFATGYQYPEGAGEPLSMLLDFFAVSWIDKADLVLKFEDLCRFAKDPYQPGAEAYFQQIASLGAFELPGDWPERVLRFGRGELSATFASVAGDREEMERRFADLKPHADALVKATCARQMAAMGYS